MARRNEFVAYLLEQLAGMGPVVAKAMFGGYGLYLDDTMFAIVARDVLYLKVDAETQPGFEARGLEPFTYARKGKPFAMSYYAAPEDTLDDAEALCRWARDAHAAAMRSAARKPKQPRRRR